MIRSLTINLYLNSYAYQSLVLFALSDYICNKTQNKTKQTVYLHFLCFYKQNCNISTLELFSTIQGGGGWQSQTLFFRKVDGDFFLNFEFSSHIHNS